MIVQRQANLLKDVSQTTVVAVGIGLFTSETELRQIASEPIDENLIRVPNFDEFDLVTEYLRDICSCGQYVQESCAVCGTDYPLACAVCKSII